MCWPSSRWQESRRDAQPPLEEDLRWVWPVALAGVVGALLGLLLLRRKR